MIKIFLIMIISFSFNSTIWTNTSDTIIHSNKISILISDTTYNCKVVTNSKSIFKKVNLYDLRDSSVKILDGNKSHEIMIDDIQYITFYGRGFMKGAAIGGGIGMLLGLIFGGNLYLGSDGSPPEYNLGRAFAVGLIFGVPFALIGGGLGALFAEDKFYDLSNLDFDDKVKKIKYLMKKFSNTNL